MSDPSNCQRYVNREDRVKLEYPDNRFDDYAVELESYRRQRSDDRGPVPPERNRSGDNPAQHRSRQEEYYSRNNYDRQTGRDRSRHIYRVYRNDHRDRSDNSRSRHYRHDDPSRSPSTSSNRSDQRRQSRTEVEKREGEGRDFTQRGGHASTSVDRSTKSPHSSDHSYRIRVKQEREERRNTGTGDSESVSRQQENTSHNNYKERDRHYELDDESGSPTVRVKREKSLKEEYREREQSSQAKRAKLRKPGEVGQIPSRDSRSTVKLESTDEPLIIEVSDNKLRTQRRRMNKNKSDRDIPVVEVIDADLDDPPPSLATNPPEPTPNAHKPRIAIKSFEKLLPVRKVEVDADIVHNEPQQCGPIQSHQASMNQSTVGTVPRPVSGVYRVQENLYHQPQPLPVHKQPKPLEGVKLHVEHPQPSTSGSQHRQPNVQLPYEVHYGPHQEPQSHLQQQQLSAQQEVEESLQQQPTPDESESVQNDYGIEEPAQSTTHTTYDDFTCEVDTKPFLTGMIPSIPNFAVEQVQSLQMASSTSETYEISKVCINCNMKFVHSCTYPPTLDPNETILTPSEIFDCRCSVIFLHTTRCQVNNKKVFVSPATECGLIKQVDRIHKYECHECEFKYSIEGLRTGNHHFTPVTNNDGTFRSGAKRYSKEIAPLLEIIDKLNESRYRSETKAVRDDFVKIRRRLIHYCTQGCCVIYHECSPKEKIEASQEA